MTNKKAVDLPDDLRLMNCAQCHREMVNPKDAKIAGKYGLTIMVHRVAGRPYCMDCYNITRDTTIPGAPSGRSDDDNPAQQNALRNLEDG